MYLKPDELAHKITDILSDMQAEDILLLDIRNAASFADYFVIGTATSHRQLDAVLTEIDKRLHKEQKLRPMGIAGESESGWVLLDYGDVIVHLFGPEERAYYDLEGLWATGVPVVRIV
ncbi:MAG: ribosome silencing factor [Chloroflexota bacterium]